MSDNKQASEVNDDRGKPDEQLQNGPLENRECRDILFCLLFILSTLAMIAISAYGLKNGNPTRLTYPYDPDGNACGLTAGYEKSKYVYFPVPQLNFISRSICVEDCPTLGELAACGNSNDGTALVGPKYNSKVVSAVPTKLCPTIIGHLFPKVDSAQIANYQATNMIIQYNTKKMFNKFCMPFIDNSNAGTVNDQNAQSTLNSFSKALNLDVIQGMLSDIQLTFPLIVGIACASFVVAGIYMILMRYCSGVLVWTSIIALLGALVAFTYFQFKQLKVIQDSADYLAQSEEALQKFQVQAAILGIVGAITIFMIFTVLCAYKKINLVIAILKTSANFMGDNPKTLLLPPFFGILTIGFWIGWMIIALFVYSSGEIVPGQNPFASVQLSDQERYMMWYFIFGALWKNAFFGAILQFILVSTVSIWYFAQGSGQPAHSPISRSIYRAFRYHLGSLALGSFLLAIVQFIRLALEYISRQAKTLQPNNKVLEILIACLKCYMACFQRFIEFLNKNAYIQISLTGKGFCQAAYDAFWMIARNPAKFAIMATLGNLFVFFGKIFICGVSCFIGYLALIQGPYKDDITGFIGPLLIIGISTFIIGDLFMSIYGMACDCILQCFLVDQELNKAGGPKHCPATLKEFVDKQ